MDTKTISDSIQTVFDNVIITIKEIAPDEFNTVPFEDSWTSGQVAEHIEICSRGIPDSSTQEPDRPYNEKVEELTTIFLDMEMKSKSAPRVAPHEPPHDKEQLIQMLTANKEKLLRITNEKNLEQLCLDMEFPFMGYLTRYEWLNFIIVHTQRHLNQINNIQQHLAQIRQQAP